MADIEKLDLIIKNIETFPKQHMQWDWGRKTECGTAFCVAGWAAQLDHAELQWFDSDEGGQQALKTVDGLFPGVYGATSLGLTTRQADQLFDENNSVATIKAMRDALSADPDVHGDALWEIADGNDDR